MIPGEKKKGIKQAFCLLACILGENENEILKSQTVKIMTPLDSGLETSFESMCATGV